MSTVKGNNISEGEQKAAYQNDILKAFSTAVSKVHGVLQSIGDIWPHFLISSVYRKIFSLFTTACQELRKALYILYLLINLIAV